MVILSKKKSPVKSSGYLVKVRLSSFGPVIVQEIWKCNRILIVFQGLLHYFSSPYITHFLKSKATSLFTSPKFNMDQVEVESYWIIHFFPYSITFPPTPSLRLVHGLFYGTWCSCTTAELLWHSLHSIRKSYQGWKLITWPSPQLPHLHQMVILNRAGLEGGPKAKKLIVSSSISITNSILLSVLSGCQ